MFLLKKMKICTIIVSAVFLQSEVLTPILYKKNKKKTIIAISVLKT